MVHQPLHFEFLLCFLGFPAAFYFNFFQVNYCFGKRLALCESGKKLEKGIKIKSLNFKKSLYWLLTSPRPVQCPFIPLPAHYPLKGTKPQP